MTDDDTGADPGAEAPVPEAAPPEPDAAPARRRRPVGRLVRSGCIILGLIGLFYVYAGVTFLADPDGVTCADARAAIEDEAEDVDADSIECADAIPQAEAIEDADIRDEDQARTQGGLFVALGVFQAAGGALTARVRTKRARLIALVAAGFGIVLPLLGVLSIALLAFVVYAIFFSADARAVFGEPSGPRMFRPRT